MKPLALKILSTEKLTTDSLLVSFAVPFDLSDDFHFIPGEYLTVELEIGGERLRRPYSICAHTAKSISILVKRIEHGRVSNYINDNFIAGQEVKVMPPQGSFFLETAWYRKRNYVFFAAGSGITPIISMVESVLKKEPFSTVTLYFANRRLADILFRKRLDQLAAKYSKRFYLQHLLSQERAHGTLFGRLDETMCSFLLSESADTLADSHFYMCGPTGFMEGIESTLKKFNVSEKRIHQEYFGIRQSSNYSASREEQKVEVWLDGDTYLLPVKSNQCILDAAIEADLDANYSCRAGVCSSCKAKVLSGKVNMRNAKGLTKREIEMGYVLTCQAVPATEDVKLEYCN